MILVYFTVHNGTICTTTTSNVISVTPSTTTTNTFTTTVVIFSSMSITGSRVTLIDPGGSGMTIVPSLTVSSYSNPLSSHTVENTVTIDNTFQSSITFTTTPNNDSPGRSVILCT